MQGGHYFFINYIILTKTNKPCNKGECLKATCFICSVKKTSENQEAENKKSPKGVSAKRYVPDIHKLAKRIRNSCIQKEYSNADFFAYEPGITGVNTRGMKMARVLDFRVDEVDSAITLHEKTKNIQQHVKFVVTNQKNPTCRFPTRPFFVFW